MRLYLPDPTCKHAFAPASTQWAIAIIAESDLLTGLAHTVCQPHLRFAIVYTIMPSRLHYPSDTDAADIMSAITSAM